MNAKVVSIKLHVGAQSFTHVQLFVAPWIVAHQAPLSMGLDMARILEWVAISSSRGSSQPRDQTHISSISYTAGGFFTYELPGSQVDKYVNHYNLVLHFTSTSGFSSSHIWMWELDHKQRWGTKNWCFSTVVLEKTLESPLDCKEIKPVNSKGNQSWIFIGRTDAEAKVPILWSPDAKSWLIGKDPDAGKDWKQEEKGTT